MSLKRLFIILILAPLWGCGYSMQTSKENNVLRDRYGIQKLFLDSIQNKSYQPGLENVLFNEVKLAFAQGRRVRWVSHLEDADAEFGGEILDAKYLPSAQTSSNSLFPSAKLTYEMPVATEYLATLTCHFFLLPKGKTIALWQGTFTQSKRFPGSAQKGIYGNTAPLIQESEFGRAVQELSRQMLAQVHEAMLAMF